MADKVQSTEVNSLKGLEFSPAVGVHFVDSQRGLKLKRQESKC